MDIIGKSYMLITSGSQRVNMLIFIKTGTYNFKDL